eukprot:TRINITY_DN30151_c0_g1_i1.p1 TRINITY_DN30151_c0_g1~~TRINITY_DN30151_c0_g1_i1.p1  ORF type:complete len:232 (+),score=42.05 TRINITY_DN30151_c0_g1_i1:122-817(+)
MMMGSGGVPGVGADGGKKGAVGFGMGMMVFFTLLWITGVVLLAVGLSNESYASEYDPATDWTSVAGGCRITSVSHVADQRTDKNPYCVDVYTYIFTKAADSTKLTSEPDEQRRNGGGGASRCDTDPQAPATHTGTDGTLPTAAVPCWSLASGKVAADLGTFYKCGPAATNADCVKILDPAKEHGDKIWHANLLKTLGSIFLGVGLPFCGIAGMLVARCKKKPRDDVVADGP